MNEKQKQEMVGDMFTVIIVGVTSILIMMLVYYLFEEKPQPSIIASVTTTITIMTIMNKKLCNQLL